ncbi:MAG: metalloregulator ArsR/SmtB family transcription factor [Pseudomonadota bacterium]
MKNKTKAQYEARAKIVKAMAHPSRLFIIDKLAESEKCVQELTKMIGADISTVSKHLAVLKEAGIIISEKRKTSVYYKLKCPCVVNFFTCVEDVIKTNVKDAKNLI